MSDGETGANNEKGKFAAITENPFFTFAKPYLDFVGKGKIFGLVYFLMAAINLLLPFVIIVKAASSGIFKIGAKFAVAFVFAWLIILFACWIGFQIWWHRRKKVIAVAEAEFIATPIFSEILQTFGEWLGTLTGIIGAGVGLISAIFLGEDANYLFNAMGMRSMGFGLLGIIIGPIIGFLIIIISRFLAEQMRILTALANNTKEIAANIKNKVGGGNGV
jgi:MFS family permease